jgi:hypothetical protein
VPPVPADERRSPNRAPGGNRGKRAPIGAFPLCTVAGRPARLLRLGEERTAALWQAAQIARARAVSLERMVALINENIAGRDLPVVGEPRVNVLTVNLALDRKFGMPRSVAENVYRRRAIHDDRFARRARVEMPTEPMSTVCPATRRGRAARSA